MDSFKTIVEFNPLNGERWTRLTNAAGDGGFLFPPGFPSHIIEELNKTETDKHE